MSEFGSARYDEDFGCLLWEMDFQLVFSINQWKDRMKKSLLSTLDKYESRLQDITISLDVIDEVVSVQGGNRMRRKLTIEIRGKLRSTGLPYTFWQPIFLNPLSME